jgi:hypothetical protein
MNELKARKGAFEGLGRLQSFDPIEDSLPMRFQPESTASVAEQSIVQELKQLRSRHWTIFGSQLGLGSQLCGSAKTTNEEGSVRLALAIEHRSLRCRPRGAVSELWSVSRLVA